jgi:hypothetical protein
MGGPRRTPWPKPAPRVVGVDVGTFEGLLAVVVLDAGSQFIGASQPF